MARFDSQPPVFMDSGIHFDEPARSASHKMKKILRHWLRLGRVARVAFFRTVANNLAKTPAPLTNPNPPLAAYTAKVAAAEAALALIASLEQQLRAARLAAVGPVDDAAAATELMAHRTEDEKAGDPALMTAVGFFVASDAQPAGPMTQPQDFEVTAGDNEGEIDWQCTPVPGYKSMEPRTTTDPNDPTKWKYHTAVTRSNGTITGLGSGVRIYAEVRAIGPDGPGPWSDLAHRMVP